MVVVKPLPNLYSKATQSDLVSASGQLPQGAYPVASSVSGTIYQLPNGQQVTLPVSGNPLYGANGYQKLRGEGGQIDRSIVQNPEAPKSIPQVSVQDIQQGSPTLKPIEQPENVKKLNLDFKTLSGSGLVSDQQKINELTRNQHQFEKEVSQHNKDVQNYENYKSTLEQNVQSFNEYIKNKNAHNVPYTSQDLETAKNLSEQIKNVQNQGQQLQNNQERLGKVQSFIQNQFTDIKNRIQPVTQPIQQQPLPQSKVFSNPTYNNQALSVVKQNQGFPNQQSQSTQTIQTQQKSKSFLTTQEVYNAGKSIFEGTAQLISPVVQFVHPYAVEAEKGIYGIGSEVIYPVANLSAQGIFAFGKEFNQTFPNLIPTQVKERNLKVLYGIEDFINPENKPVEEIGKQFAGTAFEYGTYLIPGNFAVARGVQSSFLESNPKQFLKNVGEATVFAGAITGGFIALNAGTNAVAQGFPEDKFIQGIVGGERVLENIAFTKVLPTTALAYLGGNAVQSLSLPQEEKFSQLGKQGAFAIGYQVIGAVPKLVKGLSFYIGPKINVPQERVIGSEQLEGIHEFVNSQKSAQEALEEFRSSKPPQEVLELFPEYKQGTAEGSQTPSVENILKNAENYVVFKPVTEFYDESGNPFAAAGYQYSIESTTGETYGRDIIFPKGSKPTQVELIHETGHKLLLENPLYKNVNLSFDQIVKDFVEIQNAKNPEATTFIENYLDIKSYPKGEQTQELLVRLASNFPEELINPTTKTTKFLSDVYSPLSVSQFNAETFFVESHVTPNIFPSAVEITPGQPRGLESSGLSGAPAATPSIHFAGIGEEQKYDLFGKFDLSNIFGKTPAIQYIQVKGFERLPEEIRTNPEQAKEFLDVLLPSQGESGTAYLTSQYEQYAVGLGGKSEIETKLPITPNKIGLTRVQPESFINRIFGGFTAYTNLNFTNARGETIKGNIALVPTIATVGEAPEKPSQVFFETISEAFGGSTYGSEFKATEPAQLQLLPSPFTPSKQTTSKTITESISIPSFSNVSFSNIPLTIASIKFPKARSGGGGGGSGGSPELPPAPSLPTDNSSNNSNNGSNGSGGSGDNGSGGSGDNGSGGSGDNGSGGSGSTTSPGEGSPGSSIFIPPITSSPGSPSGGGSRINPGYSYGFTGITTPFYFKQYYTNQYTTKKKNIQEVNPAFDVFLKKRIKIKTKKGKKKFISQFVKENKNPNLTRAEAIALGIQRTKKSIKQSFEVLPNQNIAEQSNFQLPFELSKYYQNKKNPNVFVQKREFAISSPGEKLDLKIARQLNTAKINTQQAYSEKQYYQNERVYPRRQGLAVVNTDNGILLVSGRSRNFILPGGGANRGESRKSAAVRELYEETGLKGKNPKFLFEYKGKPFRGYSGKLLQNNAKVFLVEAKGVPKPKHEVKNIAFFNNKINVKGRVSNSASDVISKFNRLKLFGKQKL